MDFNDGDEFVVKAQRSTHNVMMKYIPHKSSCSVCECFPAARLLPFTEPPLNARAALIGRPAGELMLVEVAYVTPRCRLCKYQSGFIAVGPFRGGVLIAFWQKCVCTFLASCSHSVTFDSEVPNGEQVKTGTR